MRLQVVALTLFAALMSTAGISATVTPASAAPPEASQQPGVGTHLVLADEWVQPITLRSAAASDDFAFLATNEDGSPVRWNPCQTITWQWNKAKTRDLKVMRKAVKKLAASTGMTFVRSSAAPVVTVRYSSRPRQQGALGLGGFRYTGGVKGQAVGGFIEIDKRLKKKKFKKTIPKSLRKELFMHEWGHVVGLDHVSSTKEIMFPSVGGLLRDFGTGDQQGLAALGVDAGCDF